MIAILQNLSRNSSPESSTSDDGKDYLDALMAEELRAAAGAERYDDVRARLRAYPELPLLGLPRLSLSDLDVHNSLRLLMARASEPLCEAMWTGTKPPEEEFLRAFGGFTGAEAQSWARIMALATVSAFDDPTVTHSDGVPPEAIDEIAMKIPDNEREPFRLAFEPGAASPADGCKALRILLEHSKGLPDELRAKTLRSLLAP